MFSKIVLTTVLKDNFYFLFRSYLSLIINPNEK